MRAPWRAVTGWVVAGALSWAGTGCGAAPEPVTAPPQPRPSVEPSRTPDRATAPDQAPEPGSMRVPATRSGVLSASSFPGPAELGPGWRLRVDPGDLEEGYVGNGTPVLARDPVEVALAAVPFGCPRHPRLPVAEDALEVDYRYAGRAVVAVRTGYATPALALDAYRQRARALARCTGVVVDRATGPLVTGVSALGARAMSSARTPRSDPYLELAAVAGRDLLLVALRGSPGDEGLGPLALRRLLRAFRDPAAGVTLGPPTDPPPDPSAHPPGGTR